MNRRRLEMGALFLEYLDELATHPTWCGGTPENPMLDRGSVIDIFLDEIDWDNAPYATVRSMFAALLTVIPTHEIEALLSRAQGQLADAEAIYEEEVAKIRTEIAERIEERKTSIVEALDGRPELLDQWLEEGERIVAARSVQP